MYQLLERLFEWLSFDYSINIGTATGQRIRDGSNMLYCFLLLTSFGSVNSVRRDAQSEKAFMLFPKTDVENNDKEVSLYINESTLIATWTWKNGPVEVKTNPDYTGRIVMDINRNIWILEVDVNDTAKYCIKCNRTDKGIEVELNALGKSTEEEIKNGLDDHPQFIEKCLDISGLTAHYFIIIVVIATIQLLKHVAEGYKMLKAWSCEKFLAISRAMKGAVVNCGASGDDCVTFGANKERSGGRKVKDRNFDPGLSRTISLSEDHSDSILSKIDHMLTSIDEKVAIFVIYLLVILFLILHYAQGQLKRSKNTLTEDEIQEWLFDHPDFMEKHLGMICEDTTVTSQKDDTEGTSPSPIIAMMTTLVSFVISIIIMKACGSERRKILKISKNICIQCERRLQRKQESERRGEKTSKGKHRLRVSDKPILSLKWRFSVKTRNSEKMPWLLDLILNPDDDLIVTDAQNNELKKFSLEGKLKYRLNFETRPDCLALTDGYNVAVTFPLESKLRVVNTKAELIIVSEIEFKFHCTGISSMKDGRLIIGNRESKSVFMCSKEGKILQEIKNDSSGETLFRKPSYVRVVDNGTIYVSDCKTKQFVLISINEDNKYGIRKYKITDPCTSCVVDGLLFVAASIIRIYTLDGYNTGNLNLDGVQHVRGLAFSEDKRLLIITHKSDAEDKISVYEVTKSSTAG